MSTKSTAGTPTDRASAEKEVPSREFMIRQAVLNYAAFILPYSASVGRLHARMREYFAEDITRGRLLLRQDLCGIRDEYNAIAANWGLR